MGSRIDAMKLCILSCWVFSLTCGFVLLSSAEETEVFHPGKAWSYGYRSTLALVEKGGTEAVGFNVEGHVTIESKWAKDEERLLRIKLEEPKLHRKGVISALEFLTNHPFYVVWKSGQINKLLVSKEEPTSLVNLKKGIASLLQFQILDMETKEVDSSGNCEVKYTSDGPNRIVKNKWSCQNSDLERSKNPDPLLGANVDSKRVISYEFSVDRIENVIGEEEHEMSLSAREQVGNKLISRQELQFERFEIVETVNAKNYLEAFYELESTSYDEHSLVSELEHFAYDDGKTFAQIVGNLRNNLITSKMGSITSAKSFLKLVDKARHSIRDDISKALTSKKNNKIMHQLVDILGYVQTSNSHDAINKLFHYDDAAHEEYLERYLWALQTSSKPNPEIILDLVNKFKKTQNIKENVKETMVMAIASMAHHLIKVEPTKENLKVHRDVEELIVNYMDATGDLYYLRALRNLRSPTTVHALLKIISEGNLKQEILAWKALKAMDGKALTPDVFRAAEKTFYQLDKVHDSSARTLALDVILESEIVGDKLEGLVHFLIGNDKAFEIKQYAIQRFRMLSESCPVFRGKLMEIISGNPKLLSYSTWGQKGLSVALVRPFLVGGSSNGSLLTVQEMNTGIVKRGRVNVVMDKDSVSQEMFSLGVFSGGLSSFISSDSEETGDDEPATAGMELSILGNQLRPFTFFSGQGELMGHVFSGTASERTTAFQALAMLHDQKEFIRLGSGFVAELELAGAASLDLAGQIQFSLWNKNAESLVEKSSAILVVGTMRVDNSLVRSEIEFVVSIEPKLNLQTDIDFYNDIMLCMRLTQPETILRHGVYKIERIPGSKHRVRKSRTVSLHVSGRTYALNRKNSEMCSKLFK
ncbi:PREDICTED: microsomal triglyceride transfer protein large subunit [Nicrophorus vespilloides]|uniref:Microsomal triglyceride transfer protein large subunit n=1 Tax=Nicrophorus vespilloides TaxID=110193 RepID=A0ABM1N416_NICVS|nr:PREDICTED: microsomal triglyceride transfer protein large subunit [Nicrophorus vespilloides]XP_017781566.1 PREDICTED: microsomal triglyceride transfer protein large subunit [Nicrophorus vespilloides]XP_017781567.1 PREDICTED: microsomal triglyceride transfer protein large subunit [Nicrophorus vespilloides]XP_017781568.1 PREDICTED: microsomal triglyceride transfer protein large subunit [Nicrophorus vespilloides]XP_017781569.1 PREDICTED: microsomal triglyceride transfer protein large subunit [N